MLAPVHSDQLSHDAPSVCLHDENPNRLVSLWEIMEFDAGRFGTNLSFLFGTKNSLEAPQAQQLESPFADMGERDCSYLIAELVKLSAYCQEFAFPMAKIPVDRMVELSGKDNFTIGAFARLLGSAWERLGDEATTRLFFHVPNEKASYYRAFTSASSLNNPVEEAWNPIFQNFASTKFDATEAFKGYALGRNTSCVFHLMRVLELGLTALGAIFNVSLAHTNWAPALVSG